MLNTTVHTEYVGKKHEYKIAKNEKIHTKMYINWTHM